MHAGNELPLRLLATPLRATSLSIVADSEPIVASHGRASCACHGTARHAMCAHPRPALTPYNARAGGPLLGGHWPLSLEDPLLSHSPRRTARFGASYTPGSLFTIPASPPARNVLLLAWLQVYHERGFSCCGWRLHDDECVRVCERASERRRHISNNNPGWCHIQLWLVNRDGSSPGSRTHSHRQPGLPTFFPFS